MVYIVIGIVLAVAVGAIIKQRSRRPQDQADGMESEQDAAAETDIQIINAEAGGMDIVDVLSLPADAPGTPLPAPPPAKAAAEAEFGPEEEIVPLKPILAAEPLSSPNTLNSATYTSLAQQSAAGDSPYAYGNTVDETSKPKPETTLLRWSGKSGAIQIGDLTVRGPVAYWSDGPSSTPEPSCIDIRLPVEYPGGENEFPSEGAASYGEMTPLQRGVYLRWLAEGRIQPPPHACYPLVWLFGLERRVLSDRLDMGICIGESFRLLPLLRWESLKQGMINFIVWLAAKMWLPEEELLAFSRSLPNVPRDILNMLLRPYSDARLPLPSVVAFTVMRASPLAEEHGIIQPQPFLHSDDLVSRFSVKYKSKCDGGLVLLKPKTSSFVAYAPTNPTLQGDKKATGGVLELPDFFKDTENFAPLIAVWKEFLKEAFPPEAEPLSALDELEARPDWDSFVRRVQGLSDDEEIFAEPVITNLGALADLMGIDRQEGVKKVEAADRKKISEAARVEGFLILPDMGIAGKEYRWNEPVSLTPFPPGERLSQDYSAAAFTLEYACALTGLPDPHTLGTMRDTLRDYFSLSPEDNARLEALSSVLAASHSELAETRMNPNNIGDSLQFWLQREQRALFGNFLARFLTIGDGQDWVQVLRESLDVDTIEIKKEEDLQPLELGSKAAQALSPLFTG
ncbi:MAG: TerB N-terminal domain-containing protein [Synergistaceae bacterium]|nr:TerB N-terminal domain-containing protein [Synergistaceae bacterium]